MGQYTLTLEEIGRMMACQSNVPCNMSNITDILIDNLFDNYEIFSEPYRRVLNTNIVRWYMLHEIGQETYGQFRFYLNTVLDMIMPYYNDMYKVTLDGIDIFTDTDYKRDLDHTEKTRTDRDETSELKRDTSTSSGEESESVSESGSNSHSNTKDNGSLDSTSKEESGSTTVKTDTMIRRHEFDPSGQTDIQTVIHEGVDQHISKDTGKDTVHNTATPSITKESNTPQGTIADVKNGEFLSKVTVVESDGKSDNTTDYGKTNTVTDTIADVRTESRHEGKTVDTSEVMPGGEEKTITEGNRSGSKKDKTESTSDTWGSDHTDKKDNYTKVIESLFGEKSDNTVITGEDKSVGGDSHEHVYGKMNSGKSYMELIKEYRDSLINIDMMIIEDLEECFMLIY